MLVLAVAAVLPLAAAQYQAQDGWSKPRRLPQPVEANGLALDAAAGVVYASSGEGIVSLALDGSGAKLVLPQRGIRNLRGAPSKSGTALVWAQRSLQADEVAWVWWRGEARSLGNGVLSPAVVPGEDGPSVAYVKSLDDHSVLFLRSWRGEERRLYQSRLNIGAVAAVTHEGTLSIVFAEGYRNNQEDVYDGVLLRVKPRGAVERTVLGPAVYTGLTQSFAFIPTGGQPAPVWWWETPEDRDRASQSRSHNPRLAFWDGRQARPFAGPWRVTGSVGRDLYWVEANQFRTTSLEAMGAVPARPLLSPGNPIASSVDEAGGERFMAWLALREDTYTADVYVADTLEPYQPTTLDRIAVAFGWNPWFPGESAAVQSLLAALGGVLMLVLVVPLAFLLLSVIGSRAERGNGLVFALAFSWVFVIAMRALGGAMAAQPSLRSWVLAPLLTPTWPLVLAGLLAGSLLAFLLRGRASGMEIAPVAAAGLIVFVATAVAVFSRAGFVSF